MSTDREAAALDYAWCRKAHMEALAEVTRLEEKLREAESILRAELTVGEAVDAGPHGWVVLTPPAKRLPARISPEGVSRHREQLLELGLVREEMMVTRPKVADVRAKAAALAAHGVPLHEILVEPAARPTLEVVEKDGLA